MGLKITIKNITNVCAAVEQINVPINALRSPPLTRKILFQHVPYQISHLAIHLISQHFFIITSAKFLKT